MIREKVKALWKLCFSDSEEFTEMYFRLRYSNDVNIAIHYGEEIIAALQMLPYPMTFERKEIHTAYISGACTHPDYRNQGIMCKLLSQAYTQMFHKGIALSTLIPAEPWLFDYYARHGFAPVFKNKKEVFFASNIDFSTTNLTVKKIYKYSKEAYGYLNSKLKERPNCVQHTSDDFRVIIADLQISKGTIYTLNYKEKIVALAISYPNGSSSTSIEEIVADTPEMNTLLLQYICKENGISSIEVTLPPTNNEKNQPLGMARIINARIILQQYAVSHPELEMNIKLTDKEISSNCGYYYINKGKCIISDKQLSVSHLTLTIGELTETIFMPLQPYMSLMLS